MSLISYKTWEPKVSKDYLFDTNIVGYFIEAVGENPSKLEAVNLKKKLLAMPPERKIFYCVITLGEISYGINTTTLKHREELLPILDFLKSKVLIKIDDNICEGAYAELRAKLFEKFAPKNNKKKKRLEEWINPTNSLKLQIQENDLWITAVAKTYNLTLVTNDKMHALMSIAEDVTFEDWLA